MHAIGLRDEETSYAYCPACVPSYVSVWPIFATEEADTPTHCVRCEALIPHALTSEGYAYVADAIGEHLRDPDSNGRACIVAAWYRAYMRDCSPSRSNELQRILDMWADAQPSTDRYSPRVEASWSGRTSSYGIGMGG